jgi:hypothetical protein
LCTIASNFPPSVTLHGPSLFQTIFFKQGFLYHFKVKDVERRTSEIEIVTEKTSRLPIRDVAVYDIGDDGELFGLELGDVCFS